MSTEGVSDSDRISLVKLDGNMPVFPFRSPSHQPSSTWRRSRSHQADSFINLCGNIWEILHKLTKKSSFCDVLVPDLYSYNKVIIFLLDFVASTSVAYLVVLGEEPLLLFLPNKKVFFQTS